MPITIRGATDTSLASVKKALREYERRRPEAQIQIYRYNSISIRIRVIDPGFAGMRKSDRHALVWEHLETLPERAREDISMIVLLAPGEESTSLSNLEFDNPSRSML